MTIMFCDVRGFTTIYERYKADPQGLTTLVNRVLTPMTDVVLGCKGTIDKYIGDCIMASGTRRSTMPSMQHMPAGPRLACTRRSAG